jgi:hypothetical protein
MPVSSIRLCFLLILQSIAFAFTATLPGSAIAQSPTSEPAPAKKLSIPGLPQTAPAPAVIDTVNLFRSHPQLKAALDTQFAALAKDTGIDFWLVTVSFQTRDSAAQEAAEILASWSTERPALVLIHIRGNHRSGLTANSTLEKIVPTFELASTLPSSANEGSEADRAAAPDSKARVDILVETCDELDQLLRRYTQTKSDLPSSTRNATAAAPALAAEQSSRRAESILLVAVLAAAALIVLLTAKFSREP